MRNAAALLVDTRDLGVRAMVGSADFADAAIDGQVNGTLAKRSPGSALKPFIYALAIDQGLIHPLTVLRDVPTAFGPFSPGELRRALRRPDQRDAGADSVPQHSGRCARFEAIRSGLLLVPAQRRHRAAGNPRSTTASRSCSAAAR